MNDNEIVVRRGVSAGDRVLLTPPADHAGVQTVVIPGLQPVTAPVAGGDTAASVKLPSKTPATPVPSGSPTTAPAASAVKAKS
jgi:hypothetical protein